jgi:hypothetical protein
VRAMQGESRMPNVISEALQLARLLSGTAEAGEESVRGRTPSDYEALASEAELAGAALDDEGGKIWRHIAEGYRTMAHARRHRS